MNSKLFCLLLLLAVLVPSIHSQTCYLDSYYNYTTLSCNPCAKSLNSSTCAANETCISYYWYNVSQTLACKLIPTCGTGFWFDAVNQKCIDCTTFINQTDCAQCPGFGFNFSNSGKCEAPGQCGDTKFYDFNSTNCLECNGTGNSTQGNGNVSTICGVGACHSHFWALANTSILYLGQTINITLDTCYACSMIANTLPGGPVNSVYQCACNLGFFWNAVNLTCDDCTTANDTTCLLCNNFVFYNKDNCSLCANVQNSNGGYNSQTGTCNCAIGFTWSAATMTCVACSGVTNDFECLTPSCLGYYFVNGKCGLCGDIEGTVPADNENAPPRVECICDLDLLWFVENNTDAVPVCAPCSTFNASANGTKCGTGSCINFIYSPSNESCVDNCSSVLDYNPDYPSIINGGCICNVPFFFNKKNFTCDPCANATVQAECLVQTCSDYWWSSKQTCITCESVVNADLAFNISNGVCTCLEGYFWNSTTKKCDACSSAKTQNCGYQGCASFFFKTQTKRCIRCPSIANVKTPNIPNTICDCPIQTMWSPATVSCVSCDYKIGQALNNASGACIDCTILSNKDLTKNATTISKNNSCYCASNYSFINGKCGCNATKLLYDMGNSAGCGTCAQIAGGSAYNKNTGGCDCIKTAKWNNITKKCVCNTVGYFLKGSKCESCASLGTGLTTGSNLADPFSCVCAAGLSWNTTLKTCTCTNTTQIWSVLSGRCESCTKASYFSKGTSNGQNACACNANMIWNAVTSTCICDTKSIPKGTSKLYCTACSSIIGASGAKVGTTGCGCKTGWAWNINLQICTCATTSCICPIDFALIKQVCTNCSTIIGSTGKSSSNIACACKKSFVWNTTNSNCSCPTGGMTNTNKNVCTFCDISANAYNYTTAAKTACNCTINHLWDPVNLTCRFTAGSLVMLANGTKISCSGLGGSIGGLVDNFNCKCSVGSIWNTITNKCVACNSIPFTNTTGATKNYKYSCPCNNGTSWDILTFSCRNNTCKYPLADSRCGYCLVATGVEQVSQLQSVSLKTDTFQLSGDNEFIAEMNLRSTLYSNYTSLKCKCKGNYTWNVARRACFNTSSNATY